MYKLVVFVRLVLWNMMCMADELIHCAFDWNGGWWGNEALADQRVAFCQGAHQGWYYAILEWERITPPKELF